MAIKHTITIHDKWFLNKQMKDPFTQETFKVGDTIVICKKCKTAHLDSSWTVNSNKCCSMGCDYNGLLYFNKFTPSIFIPKTTHKSNFSVIVPKLPFAEKIKLLNGYILIYVMAVLLPVMAITMLFYCAHNQDLPSFSTAEQVFTVQNKIDDFNKETDDKFADIIEKPISLKNNLGDMDNKLSAVQLSFKNIELYKKDFTTENKIDAAISNIAEVTDRIRDKVSRLVGSIADFINNLFND